MIIKPANLPFIIIIILGTIISISANSWFPIWFGIEINIIGFIPLIINKSNIFSIEASLKYFLIQTIRSSILLLISIQNNFSILPIELINLALLIKLGAAPFHFWVPSVAERISWNSLGILLTWQKLAPVTILIINIKFSNIIIRALLLSLLFGSMGGINQTSTKKILAYSSIAHIGWIITSIILRFNLTIIYFIIYSINLFLSIRIIKNLQIISINNSIIITKKRKIIFYLTILNIGGIPPLLGFFPKLITLIILIKINIVALSLILLIRAIINLFFYLRITYLSLRINNNIKKINLFLNMIPNNLRRLIIRIGPLTILIF